MYSLKKAFTQFMCPFGIICSSLFFHAFFSEISAPVYAQNQVISDQKVAEIFEAEIVNRYSAFFEKGPMMLDKQKYANSPTGQINSVNRYVFKADSYDVKKTDSIVSPFIGYIVLKGFTQDNNQCGDVFTEYSTEKSFYGYSTEKDALLKKDDKTCYGKRFAGELRFDFKFQKGTWIFSNAYFTNSNQLSIALSTVLLNEENEAVLPLESEEALKLNAHWKTLGK